jgi:hypothetical protein
MINVGGGTDGVPLLMAMSCLIDLVNDGWKKLEENNMRKVRLVANKQAQHKINTRRCIMERVMAIEEVTMTTIIPSELDVVEECQWSTDLREIRGNYNNDI